MFIDKRKLEKAYLDELTKMGNLFDTLNIDYCVVGGYSLLSYNIRSKSKMDCIILTFTEKKNKIIEILFKLNYNMIEIKKNKMKIMKESAKGTIIIELVFGTLEDKKIKFNLKDREIKLSNKFFSRNRKEVKTRKGGKGYFRVAPLELIYFLKMNSDIESDTIDLEMIKASSKMDIESLLKLFKINGLM